MENTLKNGIDLAWIPKEYWAKKQQIRLLEISNIGETMINNLQVLVNHFQPDNNQMYDILYPCHPNKQIVLALPEDILHPSVSNITIIYHSLGVDKAKTFQGEIIKTNEYITFSEITFSTNIKTKKNTKISCVRMSLQECMKEQNRAELQTDLEPANI